MVKYFIFMLRRPPVPNRTDTLFPYTQPFRAVIDRLASAVLELADAVRQAGDAALAAIPVAGRHVVQHLGQLVHLQRLGQHFLPEGVGKEVLDAPEAILGGCGKAIEEVVFAVEHGEVGGKLGNSGALLEIGRTSWRERVCTYGEV